MMMMVTVVVAVVYSVYGVVCLLVAVGVDLDECRLMPDACQHGRCINTLGSYRCLCDAGYQVRLTTGGGVQKTETYKPDAD